MAEALLKSMPSSEASIDSEMDCYHCGLPVMKPGEFTYTIQDEVQNFCCVGCQAVAGMIHQGGLDQFYQYRSELNRRPDANITDYSIYDRDDIQHDFVVPVEFDNDQNKIASLLLDGITCAACVWLIEKYLLSINGVLKVTVNASTHQCSVTWDTHKQPLSFLMQQLASIGYRPQPYSQKEQQQQQQYQQRQLLLRLGLAGFGMMQVGMVAIALYAGALQGIDAQWVQLFRWVSLLVATPIVLFSAQPFWSSAWRSLKQYHLTMDVPVSLAILLAYFASVWATISQSGEVYFDSISMFTFFLLLGRYLEMRLRYRNQQSVGVMAELLPLTVTKVSDKDATDDSVVPLVELKCGDCIRVFSGDTIPCDGVVVDGSSAVVEAIITGEAKPVPKKKGDSLIAGTVNTDGALLVEVTATGSETRLSTISHLVQKAEQDKPQLQKLADKVASYFVAVVLVISAIVFLSWWHIEPESALWVTLSVLVVTCPCALSLATPTALTATIAMMRRLGLLILKGHVIEALTKIDKVIFDKTGTLTHGQPKIMGVENINTELTESEILSIAAALEQGSSHPIARAFDECKIFSKANNNETLTGAGVSGDISGHHYRLGKPEYTLRITDVLAKEISITSSLPVMPSTKGQWLLLTKDAQALAWIGLSDQVRNSANAAVKALSDKNIGAEILSGDNHSSVKTVADALAIDFHAAQMPEEKLAYVRQQQNSHRLMMVGDGINDVPVLAGADVSVAMDSATDFARARADSVLLHGDLTILPKAIQLAKKAKKIIRQNVFWALTYNLLALPLAAFGFIPPYAAAIGMSLSSLVVVFNALRLYKL